MGRELKMGYIPPPSTCGGGDSMPRHSQAVSVVLQTSPNWTTHRKLPLAGEADSVLSPSLSFLPRLEEVGGRETEEAVASYRNRQEGWWWLFFIFN